MLQVDCQLHNKPVALYQETQLQNVSLLKLPDLVRLSSSSQMVFFRLLVFNQVQLNDQFYQVDLRRLQPSVQLLQVSFHFEATFLYVVG